MSQPVRHLLLPLVLAACSAPSDPPIVTITPEFPTTNDTLEATWELPEGAEDASIELQWFRDDALQSGLTGTTIEPARTARSQRWAVEVQATLGNRELEVGRGEVLIQNAPPTVTVSLTPDPATSGDDLVAAAEVTEPDGDPVELEYVWRRNNAPTEFSGDRVPASATAQGDSWTVVASATDGIAQSTAAEATVLIGPSPPIVRGLSFDPSPPNANVPTVLSYEAFDPDGTEVTLGFEWRVNGSVVTAATGDTLPAGSVRRGDGVEVRLTATDADDGTTTATLDATAGNATPVVGAVLVEPEEPNVTTPITCTAVGLADADGDTVNVVWEWHLNTNVTSVRTATANPLTEGWVRGDRVQCFAIPSDASGPGTAAPAELVVLGNAAPVLVSAAIEQPADDDAPLTLTIGTAADPDGDDITYTYRWLANTQLVGTGPTLEQSRYERGQTVRAFVTPVDAQGLSGGEVEATGSFVATNRPPVVLSHTPSVQIPTKDAPFEVEIDTFDPDGDPVGVTWSWLLGGNPVPSVTGNTYPINRMFRGSQLEARVVPSDGQDDGPEYVIGPYTIGNAIPVVQGGTFEVDGATTDFPQIDLTDTVRCLQTGMTDADNDLLNVVVSWSINGTEVSDAESIDGSLFTKGDEVSCTLYADDGIALSEPYFVGSFFVQNAPPELGLITLSPQTPRTNDTLTVTVTGSFDPDSTDTDAGDTVELTYEWFVGDSLESTTNQLPGTAFGRDDLVTVYVTGADAEGATTVATRSVTIANSPPTITDAFLTPSFPRTNSVITIQGTWSDPDGDTLLPDVTWRRNGQVINGQTGLTLDGESLPELFSKDDAIRATLRFSDGQLASASFPVSEVTIVDATPPDPVARISPRWSVPGDRDLRCEVAVESVDPDGDIVTYGMVWYRNDVLYEGDGGLNPPEQTVWPGDTLPKEAVQAGETWRCEITAFSGVGPGAEPGGQATAFANIADLAFRDLGLGADFGCGRDAAGTPRCWGKAGSGQTSFPSLQLDRIFVGDLGACGLDSGSVARCWGTVPAGTPTTPIVDMDIGASHACSRSGTNLVQCWGSNSFGESSPIDPETSLNVVARRIAVGGRHSCAIRDDGSIVCWGANDAGQLDVPEDGGPWVDISAGSDWTCAVSNDRELACWGDALDPVVTGAPSLARYVDVEAGAVHACAIDIDDQAVCWGDPVFVDPIAAPAGDWATVHPGQQATCAQSIDGDVVCWGKDDFGQLVPSDERLPWVAPGGEHSCALDGNGEVLCWGDDEHGQATVPFLGQSALQVVVGNDYSCAQLSNKNVVCWGRDLYFVTTVPTGVLYEQLNAGVDHVCSITTGGAAVCWGRDPDGRATAPSGSDWDDISAGSTASCGLRNDGTLECWGAASSIVVANAPDDTFAYVDVDIDATAGCAIRDVGRSVECWGSGSIVTGAPGNTGLQQVVVGRTHACALDGSGQIICWGSSLERRTTPPSGVYSELIDGREHTCAIRSFDQRTICWGPEGRR